MVKVRAVGDCFLGKQYFQDTKGYKTTNTSETKIPVWKSVSEHEVPFLVEKQLTFDYFWKKQ